jgi:undecaprenyl-diphosphatase
LALPTMVAATGLDLLKSGGKFTSSEWLIMALGMIISFGVAALSIKWLLKFVENHSLTIFGWYRIVLAIVVGLFA